MWDDFWGNVNLLSHQDLRGGPRSLVYLECRGDPDKKDMRNVKGNVT